MKPDLKTQFSRVLATGKDLIGEAFEDNEGVLFAKFDQARRAAKNLEDFAFTISASVKMKDIGGGDYQLGIKVSASSKALIEDGRIVRTEKDLVDAMAGKA